MAHLRIAIVLVGALLASSASAQAPPMEVTYDALDLADRIIDLPAVGDTPVADIEVAVGAESCTLAVGNGSISGGDCPELWGQKRLTRLVLGFKLGDTKFDVTLLPREPGGRPALFDANIPVRGGTLLDASDVIPSGGAIAIYVGDEWQPFNVPHDGMLELDADVSLELTEGPVLAYTDQVGSLRGYYQFWLVTAPAKAPEPDRRESDEPPSSQPAPARPSVDPRVFDLTKGFCRRARKKYPDDFVVCVDAERAEAEVSTSRNANILKPNTSITVVVRHLETHGFGVDIDGERGIFIAGVRIDSAPGVSIGGNERASAGEEGLEFGDADEPPPPRYVTRERTLAPRLPGPVDVVVEVSDAHGGVWSRAKVELVVEATYSSALRVGVAGVFLDGVDRDYVARLQPGAGQAEVAAVETGGYDLEVVAGFAAFLDRNGRGYSKHDFGNFAPYLGIGVLAQGADGSFDFLKSVHLGVEWELTPSFSLASTVVLRRVTRLAPGVELGGPVQGDVPTVTRQSIGLGFVLNVSPEFLRIGSPLGGL